MFSTIIAYVGFTSSSIFMALLVMDVIVNREHNKKIALLHRAAGYKTPTYFNIRMFILVAVWVASGIYIWG